MLVFIKTFLKFSSKPKDFKIQGKNVLSLMCKKKTFGFFFPSKTKEYNRNFFKKSFLFIEHLIFQNFYTNLISNSSTKKLYKNHFFDSLTPVVIFFSFWPRKKFKNCIDIGSGGGFPGLVLSFFFPNFFFCLIDSVSKKTKFHKTIFRTLAIKNSQSVCQRAETTSKFPRHNQFYHFTITRAVAEIIFLSKICLPLTEKTGKLIIMKKIIKIHQELIESLNPIRSRGGKLKGFIYIQSIKQGKVLVVIKKN
mmetsp:Transcript_15991/g.32855  ORF Transcript_15991/g.32855 Transcript_15991/m.32855 type:complete len:251 (+) Transcript_15991:2941-3693(+)